MIAVTFALPAESSAFLHLLQERSRSVREAHTICGQLHGQRVCVLHTGVGETTTRTRLALFLQEEKPQLLISSGFAGALHDRLHAGDLLLAVNFSDVPLAAKARALHKNVPWIEGRLATAPGMIDSLAERQKLAEKSGADAVDMETAVVAGLCATANVPMLSLRAISDTPARPFPAPAPVLFNIARQKTDYIDLLTYLLRHPAAVGRFISFGKQIAAARHSLAGALGSIVAGIQG
jgi:adenosylhomocysteine nucleosidase